MAMLRGLLLGVAEFTPLVLGLALLFVITVLRFMPSKTRAFEDWLNGHPRWAVLLVLLILATTVWGFWEQQRSSAELRDQIRQLVVSTTAQATAEDMRNLRQELRDGFSQVVGAIKMQGAKVTPPAQTPQATPSPVPPPVRQIHFTERPVPSDDPALPYALQVIVQTTIRTQPTGLRIEFDGPFKRGSFFVAGRPTMMSVQEGHTNDRKSYLLSFGFPPWEPETPVVATVLSAQPIRVVSVAPWHQ